MKRIEKEITTKKVEYIEAFNGRRFYVSGNITEEIATNECKKYEESAEAVVEKDVMDFRIADGTYIDLDPFAMVDDPCMIFKIDTIEQLDKLNIYLDMKLKRSNYSNCELHLSNEYIGKEVIIVWNYEMDWAMALTFEEYMKNFKDKYYAMIEKSKEKES